MIRSFSQHVNSFCLEKFDNSIFSVLSNRKTLDTTSFHQNKFSDFLTTIHKVFLQSNLLFFPISYISTFTVLTYESHLHNLFFLWTIF